MSWLQQLLTSESWDRNPIKEKIKDVTMTPHTSSSLGEAVLVGLAAGVMGTVALNLTNTLEQRMTGRPDSYVPAHTLQRLLHLKEKSDQNSAPANAVFQWGIGAFSGALRGVMSRAGMRGPYASFIHLAARVCTDQSLENSVNRSTAPWTWPHDEQLLDLAHKAAYAVVAGAITDKFVKSAANTASNRR
jgi:hypothetical protein